MLRAVPIKVRGAAFGLALCVAAAGCASAPTDATRGEPVAPASSTATVVSSNPVPPADWEVIGRSVQGRPIRMRSLGNGARHVLFIGGIHGDEPEGAYTTEQLPDAFSQAGLGDAVTLTILEDANPDGRAAGTRGNANGVDVNRNFPASNFDAGNPANGSRPLSQPEATAVVAAIDRTTPNLIIVAHAWAGKQFINFDGPAREIAERFSATSGLKVEASNEFAPTPGSLGSYAGRDRGIPLLTIEVLKGSDPRKVWEQLHPALIEAIRG